METNRKITICNETTCKFRNRHAEGSCQDASLDIDLIAPGQSTTETDKGENNFEICTSNCKGRRDSPAIGKNTNESFKGTISPRRRITTKEHLPHTCAGCQNKSKHSFKIKQLFEDLDAEEDSLFSAPLLQKCSYPGEFISNNIISRPGSSKTSSPGSKSPKKLGSRRSSCAGQCSSALKMKRDDEARSVLILHNTVAEALIDAMPEYERTIPRQWVKVIEQERSNSGAPLVQAANYARYLSLALATGAIHDAPFHQPPPIHIAEAPPLTDELWKSVLSQCSLDVSWTDKFVDDNIIYEDTSSPKEMLDKILDSKNLPAKGAVCYMAAISDIPPF